MLECLSFTRLLVINDILNIETPLCFKCKKCFETKLIQKTILNYLKCIEELTILEQKLEKCC